MPLRRIISSAAEMDMGIEAAKVAALARERRNKRSTRNAAAAPKIAERARLPIEARTRVERSSSS